MTDLYYSLEVLIQRRESISCRHSGPVSVTVWNCSFRLHRNSGVVPPGNGIVHFGDQNYIQKQGVCIGVCIKSAVAPVLSEIYLSVLDRELQEHIQNTSPGVVLVRRYADDLLICTTDSALAASVETSVYKGAPGCSSLRDRAMVA